MDLELGDEIGRGAFGIIYKLAKDPNYCVKVSNKTSIGCRQWSNEYHKIRSFLNKIEVHPAYSKMKMVRILTPTKFHETSSMCYMILPRIYRPDQIQAPTIQAQLGVTSCRLVHKGRGEFIGLKEISDYVSADDIEVAAKELGQMMALIHHVGKNDAYDVELYLGKEANSRKCRLYLADFDLSESITKWDSSTIERVTWSMDAVPYFPKGSVDDKLFGLFLKGYKKIAKDSELVDKIFVDYD